MKITGKSIDIVAYFVVVVFLWRVPGIVPGRVPGRVPGKYFPTRSFSLSNI